MNRRNYAQTAEDNYLREDVLWISSLRPLSPAFNKTNGSRIQKSASQRRAIDTSSSNNNTQTQQQLQQQLLTNNADSYGPPQFYDEYVEKWQKKFETAKESRKQDKAHMLKTFGCLQRLGTKNQNLSTPNKSGGKMQRRNSRQGTATFSGVDFDYTGNTNDVQHLIQSTKNGTSKLDFALNLRSYRNSTNFKSDQAFEYPQAQLYYDPVALDKPSFGHTHQLTKGSKIETIANHG